MGIVVFKPAMPRVRLYQFTNWCISYGGYAFVTNRVSMFALPWYTEPEIGIRLVEGSSAYQGTVEVNFNGKWGSICDDSWDNNDARVVCRQLGFPDVGYVYLSVGHAQYGSSTGSILLDDVECIGNESTIAMCSLNVWGIHNCEHTEDAGVICQGKHNTVIICMRWGRGASTVTRFINQKA